MAYFIPRPIPIIALRPIIITPHLLVRNNSYNVRFCGENIKIRVAKISIDVQKWIFDVYKFYEGRNFGKIIVGLDTEWQPNFSPEEDHPIAIIQLCVGQHCLIFQLLHTDSIPQALHAFLGDERFTFCGVGIQEDVKKLYDHHGLFVKSTMDLNEVAGLKCGRWLKRMDLKRMAVAILRKEMLKPKDVTLSAWDTEFLHVRQIEYAAIDAFVSFRLVFKLSSM